ncbi:MAG: DUF2262 domain-containing protein [Lachnospiraceae bacterium]|nr:DUF2262 domain-containing protein [Lachnospiraceae bacterium]
MKLFFTNNKFLCSANEDHIFIERYGKTFDVSSGTVGPSDQLMTFISVEVGTGERTFVIEHAFTIPDVIKAFQNGEKASDRERMWDVESFCELITKSYMQATARYYAADGLLDLKNSEWLGDRELQIDRDAFMESIELEGIESCRDGSLRLWCRAENLFSGHSIVVRLNPDFTLDDTELS